MCIFLKTREYSTYFLCRNDPKNVRLNIFPPLSDVVLHIIIRHFIAYHRLIMGYPQGVKVGRSLDPGPCVPVCWAIICTEGCTDPWACEKLWQCHESKSGHEKGRNLGYEGSRRRGRHSMPVQPVWKDLD
jgi:hypothetical protein